MGAYLAYPITDKVSSDESNATVVCGASSMQGWRKTQEDAHNCVLDFDTNASLFAVYDGHGGKEVAEYTAQKLPDFIKKTEAYARGDYVQALKDAFIAFDATLKEAEIVEVLKEIAGTKDNDSEDDLGNLKEEAQMPLEEVMAKYTGCGGNPTVQALKGDGKKLQGPVSPFLRAKNSRVAAPGCEEVSSCRAVCSSSGEVRARPPRQENKEAKEAKEAKQSRENKENRQNVEVKEGDGEVSSSSSCSIPVPRISRSERYSNGDVDKSLDSTCDAEVGQSEAQGPSKEETGQLMPDSSGQGDAHKTEDSAPCLVNGTGSHEETRVGEADEGISSSVGNGEVLKEKGKGKALVRKQPKTPEKKPTESPEQLFKNFVHADQSEETSDSDSDDVTFQGPDSTSDDEEEGGEAGGEVQEEDEGEEEEVEEEEEDEEESDEVDDDDDEDDQFTMTMTDEPGSDSGCTAVVALVKDNKVYVANAGDSRCIVSKRGEVVEMSLDHKPEDEAEMQRIVKAGGKVTGDGRVNGGLNLSRALGDHVYKQVADLAPHEQMISPLPDVRELDIDADVEFMVLACDGIWNFMSSKEVLEFVRPRLEAGGPVSKVCEELFDHCLAPDTMGDGTGCDNMTTVIVQFHSSPILARKRRAEEESVVAADQVGSTEKRHKTDPDVQPSQSGADGDGTGLPPDTTQ